MCFGKRLWSPTKLLSHDKLDTRASACAYIPSGSSFQLSSGHHTATITTGSKRGLTSNPPQTTTAVRTFQWHCFPTRASTRINHMRVYTVCLCKCVSASPFQNTNLYMRTQAKYFRAVFRDISCVPDEARSTFLQASTICRTHGNLQLLVHCDPFPL